MYTDDTFEVYCKYEAHVHKKEFKAKSGFENFLCQSPLYDPANP